jgi:hypothetical protein
MKLLSVTLVFIVLFTSIASAETVRLVMNSEKKSAKTYLESESTEIERCVSSKLGDAKWCLPQLSDQKANKGNGSIISDIVVFEVENQGYSAKEIAVAFNESGYFGLVEVDVVITSTSSFRPNDPDLSSQDSYFNSILDSSSGANIYGLWEALGEDAVTEKLEPLDVLIMDSTFVANSEVDYFDGRGFSTTALIENGSYETRSDDYRPAVDWADNDCITHGLGVAATVGAKINNSKGMAGITNNINLHALKVMTCGRGFLSDISVALNWLDGEVVEGVTPYQGKSGVINLSLAGSSSSCPIYMQEAIYRAISAGWTLVVSAGNNSKNVVDYSPANCDGVITIGALNKSGDLAEFSNFGSRINFVGQGEDILAPCDEQSDSCWWEGTSFSAPIFSGALAAIKQSTDANDEEIKVALSLSSSLEFLGSQCQLGLCGKGLPDFEKTLEVVKSIKDGTLQSITFALNASDECDQTWFVDNFGDKARLCELYKITFFGDYITSDTIYKMYSIDIDTNWVEGSKTSEGVFDASIVMLPGLDVTNRKYGFKVCQNGLCGQIFELDASQATEAFRPTLCKSK